MRNVKKRAPVKVKESPTNSQPLSEMDYLKLALATERLNNLKMVVQTQEAELRNLTVEIASRYQIEGYEVTRFDLGNREVVRRKKE